MRVTVKLIGGLVHTVGFSERAVELPAGSTVAGLLRAMGVDGERPVLVARDGWVIEPADELRDGERVVVAPVFSGG